NTTAATQQAQLPAQSSKNTQTSIMIVEIIGYGGGSGDDSRPQPQDEQRKKNEKQSSSYDPNSAFHVVGNGKLNEEQIKHLTDREKSKLDQLVNRPVTSGE
ncbi:MAG: hypothetical protein JOZ94_28435, partial [Xanthobacteraceae bacterium]|nr:hypothetical protein [Xanthobacteraceae bacterium]